MKGERLCIQVYVLRVCFLCVCASMCVCALCVYCGITKECPPSKECSPATFGPISDQMSILLRASLICVANEIFV